jgi:phosphate:Na+ symporter
LEDSSFFYLPSLSYPEVLKSVFTEDAKSIIKRYTSNIFSSIAIGALLTVLLDSSSAVIILVIVFINAQTLTFRQAIGLIMGANIGTTFSSQIIALSVGKYSIVPLLIGFAMMIFLKSKHWKSYGRCCSTSGCFSSGCSSLSIPCSR